MTPKILIMIIICLFFSYGTYAYFNYKETGGFEKGSIEYYGYRYFLDNNISKLTSCEAVNKEFGEEASKEWMTGCNKYIEMNKQKSP